MVGRPGNEANCILPDAASHLNSNERRVDVRHYVTVTCTFSNSREHDCHQSWTLARVSWFSPHPSRYIIGKPAELWCSNLFETFGMQSYVPLDHLLCRCAPGPYTVNGESLLVVVPLV